MVWCEVVVWLNLSNISYSHHSEMDSSPTGGAVRPARVNDEKR